MRTRAALVEAAFQLVAEKGLEGLRTRDIAVRAKVNVATLHYHFATKDALIEGVLGGIKEAFEHADPGEARSSSLRENFAGTLHAFAARPGLAVVLQELALRAHRDPRLRCAFHAIFDGWNRGIEQIVAHDVASGRAPAEFGAADLARAYTAFIIGATLQTGVHPKGYDLAELGTRLSSALTKLADTSCR